MAELESVRPDRAINRENTIQMVDLVLEELREGAVQRLAHFAPGLVPVRQGEAAMATKPDEQFREAQAVIPQVEHLIAEIRLD
jgi:hypothetical protein